MLSWPSAGTLALGVALAWPNTGQTETPPLPPPRPAGSGEASTTVGPTVAAPDPDLARCLARLDEMKVVVEPLPPIAEGVCRVEHPLRLEALSPTVKVTSDVRTVCAMAEAAARWVAEIVEPAARQHLGRSLATVSIGTSYACRGQNRVAGAKPSEHGAANALDIAGFTFTTGAPVGVKATDEAAPEGRFVLAVRSGACGIFTTVLGPGSDAYHADHLHLDLRPRRGNYRICQ